jgi:hypothetical protein
VVPNLAAAWPFSPLAFSAREGRVQDFGHVRFLKFSSLQAGRNEGRPVCEGRLFGQYVLVCPVNWHLVIALLSFYLPWRFR